MLVARFYGHHVDVQDVLAYAVTNFKKNGTRDLVERTLPRVADCEQRARLLLAFVHMFPKIETRCCKFAMCFNCKRIGYHNKCEEFEHAVDESQCLVRCRNCRVMLMKVEGCNTVDCVCGFRMWWTEEVMLRSMSKKKVLPVDLFDKKAVYEWQQIRYRVVNVLYQLHRKHEQVRRQRMGAWVLKYKGLVGRTVERWVWRHRFTMALREMTERHERIRRAHLNTWIQTYKPLVFRSVERWVWRIRFIALLLQAERDLFWRAYHRVHPEETGLAEEEANAFLAIEV